MFLADGSDDACGAEGQDPALPGSPLQLPVVPPPAAPAPELSPVEQFAQEVRSKAKWGPAVDVNVRGLMASGVMAGQPVHIQLKHKDPVYLQGETPMCFTSGRTSWMFIFASLLYSLVCSMWFSPNFMPATVFCMREAHLQNGLHSTPHIVATLHHAYAWLRLHSCTEQTRTVFRVRLCLHC